MVTNERWNDEQAKKMLKKNIQSFANPFSNLFLQSSPIFCSVATPFLHQSFLVAKNGQGKLARKNGKPGINRESRQGSTIALK
jgi:hypothetical protein